MTVPTSDPPQELYQKCYKQISKEVTRWKQQQTKAIEHRQNNTQSEQVTRIEFESSSFVTSASDINVLVVDDDDCIHDTVRLLLEYDKQYQITCAETIEEMWAQLTTKEFDVILLDIHLPDGNSLVEIPKIRRHSPETRIVPLTIEKDPDYISINALVGVDGWITKGPDFPKMFRRVLYRVAENASGPSSRILIVPTDIQRVDIIFDAEKGRFSKKERQYLSQVVETMHFLPKRNTRYYHAANALGISETSLKDYHSDIGLPAFATIQKPLCAAVAAAVQWMYPALSLEQVTDRVSSYSARTLDRLTCRVFGLTLFHIRKLRDLRTLTTETPFPISFVVMYPEGSDTIRVGIRAVIRVDRMHSKTKHCSNLQK